MYNQPARRRATTYGLAGAPDRQASADRHTGTCEDYLRRHEREAKQAARGSRREREQFAQRLLSRASDTRNIRLAIEHCGSRGQAPGPDGLRPADLDQEGRWTLARTLSPLVQSGEYSSTKPRTIWIAKGGNRGQRPVHIQTFADRVVERAVLQVIRPFLQPQYLDCSLGFRSPGVSREEAILCAELQARRHNRWVWISQDLKDAFENVPRARLIQVTRKLIPADDVCGFIDRLTARESSRGIRQGGPLSPELLNVYLHGTLDRWWQQQHPEAPLLRVADDLLILATSEDAEALHEDLQERCQAIGMPLKHAKATAMTGLLSGMSVTWLGYDISRVEAAERLCVKIADRSWERLTDHLRLAWEEPCPSITAQESILGWIGQQGAAYRREDVWAVYTGINRLALQAGFDEIPGMEEMASHWYQAYLRDWINRRESLLHEECTRYGLADGSADQHSDFAANIDRSGVERLTDAPPQPAPIRREVWLYCDGSCLAPSGTGGWAWLLVEPETGWQQAAAEGVHRTTNNRSELTAVIQGLTSLPEPARVQLVVDSEYVHRGITEWMRNWERNGWRAGRRRLRPLKNRDLWLRLAAELNRHHVTSRWVRGHSGHPENEFVDRLAREAAKHLGPSQEQEA